MNFILKLKHYQVFSVIIIGLFLSNFTIEGNQALTVTLSVIGVVTYFLWPFLVGYSLYQYLPRKVELNYNLFIVNSFVWLTAYIIVLLISDGQGMTFVGVAALPLLYVFYALLHYMMFPARVLKSIEKGREVGIGECLMDFILIACLPIGIWLLQPRINKVIEQDKI